MYSTLHHSNFLSVFERNSGVSFLVFSIQFSCRSAKKGYVLISLMLVSSLIVTAVLIGYYKIEVNLTDSVIHGNTR